MEEGHLMVDHVHMLMSIPPKYSVSQVVGYMKGKSAIPIARRSMEGRGTLWGRTSGRRGYWVSTVGQRRSAGPRRISESRRRKTNASIK